MAKIVSSTTKQGGFQHYYVEKDSEDGPRPSPHSPPGQAAAWTRARLFTFMRTRVEELIKLAERKNNDYTGVSDDPFFNLRRGDAFGIAVRLDDKVSRLLSLTREKRGPEVASESVEDTAGDIVNYALLLLGLLEESKDGFSR